MGSPAGVTDPSRPGHACPVLCFFAQIRDPPRHFAHCNLLPIHDRKTCRIIAPVFQLFQAVQQERRGALRTGKSNNSTHKDCLPELIYLFLSFYKKKATKTGRYKHLPTTSLLLTSNNVSFQNFCSEKFTEPFRRFFRCLPACKSREAEPTLAAASEPGTGCAHDTQLL